jgi:hypothetical protein
LTPLHQWLDDQNLASYSVRERKRKTTTAIINDFKGALIQRATGLFGERQIKRAAALKKDRRPSDEEMLRRYFFTSNLA